MAPIVFFSWQDDDPKRKNILRNWIEKSCKELECEYDESTYDVPGMPNIPSTIKDKIQKCDIFIADIGIVCSNEKRKFPNPNVLIELGYALGFKSWETIICICYPEDDISQMPFDIKTDRISRMPLPPNKNEDENQVNKRSMKELKKWIQFSIEKGPKKELKEFLLSQFNFGKQIDKFPKDSSINFTEGTMSSSKLKILQQKKFSNFIEFIDLKRGNSFLPFEDVDNIQLGYSGIIKFKQEV